MTATHPTSLSDSSLLAETARAAGGERRSTVDLLALLAEVDRRKLYRCRGYPSLFAYCTRVLHLSEPAAYSRITAARAARQFPIILTSLADGDVTLTTITLLAPHLTSDNHDALLAAARHKGKRDVERLIAILDPHPAVPPTVRRLPAPRQRAGAPAAMQGGQTLPGSGPILLDSGQTLPDGGQILPDGGQTLPDGGQTLPDGGQTRSEPAATPVEPRPLRTLEMATVRPALRMQLPRAVVAPLNANTYLLKVTIGEDARAKLDHIRDLLRHSIPNGDPAVIVELALSVLLEKLEKTKHAATERPRLANGGVRPRPGSAQNTRHVSAAVRRAVWARDGGRCAFIGADGRCPETGFLEFHHLMPFAAGGRATVENLELRCRTHNAFEAEEFFGTGLISPRPARTHSRRTLSGQSSTATGDAPG